MGYPPSLFPTLDPAASAALLAGVLARAREAGAEGIVAFDLDSTLLDNRPRQARILREYGALNGLAALADHHADQWQGWDARVAMAASGLDRDLIDAHLAPFRSFWKDRFFTSEYCVEDRAIAGAAAYVAAVRAAGARVFYVTGRYEEMRRGTLICFERTRFPVPDGRDTELIMKPAPEEHDDLYKARAHSIVRERGRLVAAFDNEPAHINGYRESFPDAISIHLATDHSMRDIPLADGIVSIRDFAAAPSADPAP